MSNENKNSSIVGSPLNNANIAALRRKAFRQAYDVSDADWSLIESLINSGYSEQDISKYLSDIRAEHLNQEYNSESAQAQRMRQAGLNPDLTGVGESSASQMPSAPEASAPLPSSGGKGTLAGRFLSMSQHLLQFASFGLNAYDTISNGLLKEGMTLAGLADSDVLNVLGDGAGVVADIPSAVRDLVRQRGLHGRKARKYASMVSSRINALPVILQRSKMASDYQLSQSEYKINSFKNSDEYVSSMTDLIRAQNAQQLNIAKRDAKEAELKLKFLEEHPEYTEETLEAALRTDMANADKARSDADRAATEAGTAVINQGKAVADKERAEQLAEQAKSDTPRVQADNAVAELKDKLIEEELAGYDEMISFCNEWERRLADLPVTYREDYRRKHELDRQKYMRYKKLIKKHYKNRKSGSVKVGVGPVSAGVDF